VTHLLDIRIPERYTGPKIDAHTHIGSFGSWAGLSCTAEDLVQLMELYNVTKSALFTFDNELVRKSVLKYPEKLVGYVWPNPNDGEKDVDLVRKALREWKFKGIKLHPLIHAFLPNDEIVYPIMEEARKSRVPVAIHSGHPPFSLPWSIGELAENFKDVTIVMLHMGHGHGVYIQAAINTARRFDNIFLETSGMPMHTKVKEAMKIVGENRVMYGSDIPFHDPAVEIARVSAAGLSEREMERIFYTNATEALKL
jgi:predicted TIM-barrel fold metal-dependent hydrolase